MTHDVENGGVITDLVPNVVVNTAVWLLMGERAKISGIYECMISVCWTRSESIIECQMPCGEMLQEW